MSDLCIRHLLREHREVEGGICTLEQFLGDRLRDVAHVPSIVRGECRVRR